MNVTFIVTINLDDTSDLPGTAAEIEDDLNNSGFEVTMVHAWARPSLTLAGPLPNVPTTTQQTQTQDQIIT
jgi:hypothetical protein